MWIFIYSAIVAVGAPIVIPVVATFFNPDFCFCDNPPTWTGVFFVIAAVVTAWWWGLHLRGVESPPRKLEMIGLGAVVLAVIAGTVHLAGEIIHIL
jgi:membrane protein implicated in regulation of membrane protease activity